MDQLLQKDIEALINYQPILIFMKGSKEQPRCGFSNTVIKIFNSLNTEYNTFDVLENNTIREGIKKYSKWPTIPQVYINGEFIGGSDIIVELYNRCTLQEMIETINNA